MRKFENAPVTPMKERRMLTPKRRKKIDRIPKEEKNEGKESSEKESFGNLSQNLKELTSIDLKSIHKS